MKCSDLRDCRSYGIKMVVERQNLLIDSQSFRSMTTTTKKSDEVEDDVIEDVL